MVTEGVDDDAVRDDDWCADGMGRTVADVERTVTSSDAGSPLRPARTFCIDYDEVVKSSKDILTHGERSSDVEGD